MLGWMSGGGLLLLAMQYSLCMGLGGAWGAGGGGEGVESTAGGVPAPPSPSVIGPEPRRTHPSRSENLVAGRAEEGEEDEEEEESG